MFDYDRVKDFTVKSIELDDYKHLVVKFNETPNILFITTDLMRYNQLYFYEAEAVLQKQSVIGGCITGLTINEKPYKRGHAGKRTFAKEYESQGHDCYDLQKCILHTTKGDIELDLLHFHNGFYDAVVRVYMRSGNDEIEDEITQS